MLFKELAIGDIFKCVKDKGRNMVYIKRNSNNTFYSYDNSYCLTNKMSCYVPNNTRVIKVEDDNENKTDPIL